MKFLILFALALATTSIVPISAISNGTNATVGQFPYQVGFSFFYGTRIYRCGGALIDNSWILTAASCIYYVKNVTVYLGDINFGSSKVNYTVDNSSFFIHSGYGGYFDQSNDIALIKIPYTNYTTNINKVELPPISSSNVTYEGSNATASGWGQTSENYRDLPTQLLKWGRMPVINNTDCAKIYEPRITSSTICTATPDHVSICRNDQGDPLVLDTNQTLIGVASYYENLCAHGYPNIFARVTSYLDWIRNITTSH